MADSIYYICGKCNQIEPASRWAEEVNGEIKCSHCQTANERYTWPSTEVIDLLTFVRNYPADSPEYGRVTSVFASSVLELMLEELVTKMAYEDLSYEQGEMLINALLAGYQGRSRLFALYKRIGYGSFHEAANELGHSELLGNWDAIVAVRNTVVHGKLRERAEISHSLIEKTLDDALVVFYLLHNRYNKESIEYRYATKAK